jgi:D-alanine-D-alanine ligase
MDKHIQQNLLRAEGIEVPKSILIDGDEWEKDREGVEKELLEFIGLPLVTKPTREGSSIGVTIIRDMESLEVGMESALRWDRSVLAEEFLDGIEFSCIVLEDVDEGPRVLGMTEIKPQSEFYTYDDKYMPGRCRKFTPPRNIPSPVIAKIEEEVLRAYKTLGFRSYGRIDGFVLDSSRVLITDPNSSSGMAPASFFFEQAAEAGFLPSMIISKLIEVSRRIHEKKRGPL